MAWTEQMVEDLKKMWHEGLTTGEIGKRLGVSKNSIVGKVHRLQLSGRPSPIKKKTKFPKKKPLRPNRQKKKKRHRSRPKKKSVPNRQRKKNSNRLPKCRSKTAIRTAAKLR